MKLDHADNSKSYTDAQLDAYFAQLDSNNVIDENRMSYVLDLMNNRCQALAALKQKHLRESRALQSASLRDRKKKEQQSTLRVTQEQEWDDLCKRHESVSIEGLMSFHGADIFFRVAWYLFDSHLPIENYILVCDIEAYFSSMNMIWHVIDVGALHYVAKLMALQIRQRGGKQSDDRSLTFDGLLAFHGINIQEEVLRYLFVVDGGKIVVKKLQSITTYFAGDDIDSVIKWMLDRYNFNVIPKNIMSIVNQRCVSEKYSVKQVSEKYGDENCRRLLFQLWRKDIGVRGQQMRQQDARSDREVADDSVVIAGRGWASYGSSLLRSSECYTEFHKEHLEDETDIVESDQFDVVQKKSSFYARLLSLHHEDDFPIEAINDIICDSMKIKVYRNVINSRIGLNLEEALSIESVRASLEAINQFFDEHGNYYQFLKDDVLAAFDCEIGRLGSEEGAEAKVGQLNDAKNEIEELICNHLGGIVALQDINTIRGNLHKKVIEKVDKISRRPEINKRRHPVKAFLMVLLGVLVSVPTAFSACASSTYQQTFFKARTRSNMENIASNLKRQKLEI